MTRRRSVAAVALAALASLAPLAVPAGPGPADPALTDVERQRILSHGPWPPPPAADPGNRVDGGPAAVVLGRALFGDARLSAGRRVACAHCHAPSHAWQDGRPTAGAGLAPGTRNTPSLLDAAGSRWYGWDGAADSLWAASLRPIVDPREMGGSAAAVAALVRSDPALRRGWRQTFGAPPPADDGRVLVGVAKALAAFQATLVSPRTPFDDFRDALARGDAEAMARYPRDALRGLRRFVGDGRCHLCHAGPRFSNGEFGDIGAAFFLPGGGVDPGRHGGIRALQASPYTRTGAHDDGSGERAAPTRHVALAHRNFGEFKVPGLRQLAHTAPYLHDGSLATLADVVRHYSEIDEDRLHADGERILRPLKLSPAEAADLEAFLRSLSSPAPTLPR